MPKCGYLDWLNRGCVLHMGHSGPHRHADEISEDNRGAQHTKEKTVLREIAHTLIRFWIDNPEMRGGEGVGFSNPHMQAAYDAVMGGLGNKLGGS